MGEQFQAVLNKLMNEWVPSALAVGVRMRWYEGINVVTKGVIALIVLVVASMLVRTFWKRSLTEDEDGDNEWNNNNNPPVNIILCAICFVVVFVAVFPLVFNLFSVWDWIALFDPQTALAHDIYIKLIK